LKSRSLIETQLKPLLIFVLQGGSSVAGSQRSRRSSRYRPTSASQVEREVIHHRMDTESVYQLASAAAKELAPRQVSAQPLGARWVTLGARWVALRARWVTLRARWVTLISRWVTDPIELGG
jgi:hypothetical protein